MTALFVVIMKDRNGNVDAEVFNASESAIAYAKKVVAEYFRHKDDIKEGLDAEMIRRGWVYCCGYYCESDCVYVMKKMLNPALPG